MSLKQWAAKGWLREEPASPHEIKNLLSIVERDLQDAAGEISGDWRFGIPYQAGGRSSMPSREALNGRQQARMEQISC